MAPEPPISILLEVAELGEQASTLTVSDFWTLGTPAVVGCQASSGGGHLSFTSYPTQPFEILGMLEWRDVEKLETPGRCNPGREVDT